MFEQPPQGDFDAKGFARPQNDLHCQQRMPTEFEEIVVTAHLLDTQQLLPDIRDGLFDFALRCLVGAAGKRVWPGAGSERRSSLPLGVKGMACRCT